MLRSSSDVFLFNFPSSDIVFNLVFFTFQQLDFDSISSELLKSYSPIQNKNPPYDRRVEVSLSNFRGKFVFSVSLRFLWECHNICLMTGLNTLPSRNRTCGFSAYGSSLRDLHLKYFDEIEECFFDMMPWTNTSKSLR